MRRLHKKEKREKSDLHAKKSLGQHFLHSAGALRAVADAAQAEEGDTVLEIGPGEGALTRELLSRGAHVIAIEKDTRMIPLLSETFSKEIAQGALNLIEGDALATDRRALGLTEGNYKAIGNIPYYITGSLLRVFLSQAPRPNTLVFLIQKEVAERIARSKKESLLSLSVKAYGVPRYVRTVPKGSFRPVPTVDSAILAVESVSAAHFNDSEHERQFFELLHVGFAQKRKLLRRNLERILGKNAGEELEKAGIAQNVRAEDVPLGGWLVLAEAAAEQTRRS